VINVERRKNIYLFVSAIYLLTVIFCVLFLSSLFKIIFITVASILFVGIFYYCLSANVKEQENRIKESIKDVEG
jgi:hypothetical protein